MTGTLGVLAKAHQQKLLDFETALKLLQQTNCYLSSKLVERTRTYLDQLVD